MLIGYVSDERYIALIDVLFEFEGQGQVVAARSSASGAVYADLAPGSYQVTLAKDGFGAKIVEVDVQEGAIHQFRLLSDCLLGYMWPKCVKAGEASEFRVHSDEAYKLELWRYGWE
ncbi:MAG: N,N-dimethylformamidase, partial [Candidatus Latescibacterota bacterium]